MAGNGKEDNILKSQNREKAELFEGATNSGNGEPQMNRLPEDNLVHTEFDVEELLNQEKGDRHRPERGEEREIDLGGQDIEDEVELYLVEELGYNPDSDYFSISGSIRIFEDEGSIGVIYELEEDYSGFEDERMSAPLIQLMDDEILEFSLQSQLNYSMTSVENDDGLKIGFKYDKETYGPGSEEVGKAIRWIEENLPNYDDSGR